MDIPWRNAHPSYTDTTVGVRLSCKNIPPGRRPTSPPFTGLGVLGRSRGVFNLLSFNTPQLPWPRGKWLSLNICTQFTLRQHVLHQLFGVGQLIGLIGHKARLVTGFVSSGVELILLLDSFR